MSARGRQRRLPISCEPCRIRKIRCSRPRGPSPCETCTRRGLTSECLYASRDSTLAAARPALPPSPLSERAISDASPLDENLAARVAKLEALLRAQGTSVSTSPTSLPVVPLPTRKGILSQSKSGHVRFTPLPSPCNGREPLYDPKQATANSIDMSSGPYPFSKKNFDIAEILSSLPSRNHCRQLKEVYLESFASLFHILHEPTFGEQYACFENAPESMPLSWLALLFAVLGTAVNALDSSSQLLSALSWKTTAAQRSSELSKRYRDAALRCLEADNYLWQQNVTTLQALVILVYGINHSHGQAWTLLGMTYHVALSLGCHVDPTEFGLDVIKSEERRRCWAGVMMLYMLQNTTLGHLGPDPRRASDGVQLPADLNDSDLIAEEHVLPNASVQATQMSYLLLKFRLYDISSDICSLVLDPPQPPMTLIDRMEESILQEETSWNDKYLAHSASAPLPICHEAHLNILYGYGHHLKLLLHHKVIRTLSPDTPRYRRSVTSCIESAKALLSIHNIFFTSDHFSPFGWYLRGVCSFHAFHAAVTLIAMLVSESLNDDYGDLVAIIRDCVDRFKEMAESSSICEKAAPVLRSLMNTIETWSIELRHHLSANESLGGHSNSDPHLHGPSDLDYLSEWPRIEKGFNDASCAQQSYVDDLFDHLDPQFWLSPSRTGWNQWESLLSSNSEPSLVN